jgi:hypothetical protein
MESENKRWPSCQQSQVTSNITRDSREHSVCEWWLSFLSRPRRPTETIVHEKTPFSRFCTIEEPAPKTKTSGGESRRSTVRIEI